METKAFPIGKEEVKLTHTYTIRVNEFNKVTGYKVNIKNQL